MKMEQERPIINVNDLSKIRPFDVIIHYNYDKNPKKSMVNQFALEIYSETIFGGYLIGRNVKITQFDYDFLAKIPHKEFEVSVIRHDSSDWSYSKNIHHEKFSKEKVLKIAKSLISSETDKSLVHVKDLINEEGIIKCKTLKERIKALREEQRMLRNLDLENNLSGMIEDLGSKNEDMRSDNKSREDEKIKINSRLKKKRSTIDLELIKEEVLIKSVSLIAKEQSIAKSKLKKLLNKESIQSLEDFEMEFIEENIKTSSIEEVANLINKDFEFIKKVVDNING
jgi:hypothetical protein